MVLLSDGDATLCIGQASHAWICGQLARRWPDVEPFEDVVLAAEQHDVGWTEWDLAPQLNPETGLPQSFTEVDTATRFAIWEPAPHRLASQSLYAALLVSLHGTSLRFGLDQRELQERWITQLGADREQVERNRRRLLLWDALSLALCLRWEPYVQDGFRLERAEGETFALEPWPFSGDDPLVVECEARRLAGTFTDEPALHAALARAPIERLRFTLRPG
jgi:hypothetical protein